MIPKGSIVSFVVDDVYPTITLLPTPTIELRQNSPSSLKFVTIVKGASSKSVAIDTNATSVADGVYTLILESYGDTSTGSSLTTLKTDTVKIYVTEYTR